MVGKKIIIKNTNSTTLPEMEDVIIISCEGCLCNVLTFDNKSFKVCKLLGSFEKELEQFGFIRANHNTLVNSKHIYCIIKAPKRILKLKNKMEVSISRRKFFNFK